MISREHVKEAYNHETARRDLAGEFSSMVNTLTGGQVVQLWVNYAKVEINAPGMFTGRSIRRLQIRSRQGVQILLIRNRENRTGPDHFVPSPDYVIQEGDVLLVAGERDRIERIVNL